MGTIPASQIVNVIPSVLGAAGNQLELVGLLVTQNTRAPIGQVLQFATAGAVAAYFGATSYEALWSNIYFGGFTGAQAVPQAMLVAQMPNTAVAAYMRGGVVSGLTIPQLQSISGLLNVTVDGYARSGVINLSAATSFSAAAALIQNTLNTGLATQATVQGSVGPQLAQFSGFIQGNVLTVTSVASGTIVAGGVMGTLGGVQANTLITGQLTVTGSAPGGVGTYAVSIAQATGAVSMTEAYGLLTVTVVNAGTLSVGQTVTGTGAGPSAGTLITQLGTAVGTVGTYYVNNTQTLSAGTLTTQATPVSVTFDSVVGAFVLTSGVTGAASTVSFATGAASTLIAWTTAAGAVLSQGAAPQTPGVFMSSVVAVTDNWSTFTTAFDPDFGQPGGLNKLQFSTWATQGAQNQNFMYVPWDTDINPTITVPATGSYGFQLAQGNFSGTMLLYQPSDMLLQAFVMGAATSINFNELNGRITFAFKGQTGLTATVTNANVAANLISNGYNFYGAYATAAQNFIFLYPGSISGPFKWADSYVNQIWLNNQFQLALMELLTAVNSIPFNPQGYGEIEAACAGVIQAGLNFGAFRSGVVLSPTEVSQVNSMAGLTISTVLQQRGWYLQVQDPGTPTRQARGSPVCNFWYTDGQAVQKITLNSIDIL